MKKLVFALSALALTSAVLSGSASATPQANTYTFNFDNLDDIVQHDDGKSSGYWTYKVSTTSRSTPSSVEYKMRSLGSTGRTWTELATGDTTQGSSVPVTVSFWLYVPASSTAASAPAANPWQAAAYAAGTTPHDQQGGHAPTAGWSYQDITNTPGTWKQYTFTSSIDTTGSQPHVAVGVQARWPGSHTYYIDDVSVVIG